MGGCDNTRAVSEVMGAILVFSLLVTALGAYQAVIVPNQNEDIEFKHNKEVQQDFIDLRNSIHRSSTDGDDTSVAVDLGVQYPSRALTLNPPAQGGTIRTQAATGSDRLIIQNATVDDNEIDDYWNGDDQKFTSGIVEFEPAYNLYHKAPTTKVENGIVYNHFADDDEFITLSGQRVVSGRKISLVVIDGDLSRSQVGETAIDVNADSAGSTRIPVTNKNGNLTVKIPTKLSEKAWVTKLLDDQIDNADSGTTNCDQINSPSDNSDSDRFIENCDYRPDSEFNTLVLYMEPGQTYTLNLAKVSVGKNAASPSAHYVDTTKGDGVSVPERGNQELVLQVRDRFDNPVTGETVNLSLDPQDQGSLTVDGNTQNSFTDVKTDENGEVTVTYNAPPGIDSSPVQVDVDASYNFSPTPGGPWTEDARQNATFDLKVINASKINRTKPLFNSPRTVAVTASEFSDTTDGCGTLNKKTDKCKIELFLENKANEKQNITEIRYVFSNADGQGSTSLGSQGSMEVQGTLPLLSETDLPVKGEYKDIRVEFDASEQKVMELHLFNDELQTDAADIGPGDFFIITIIIDGDDRQTFVFSPVNP